MLFFFLSLSLQNSRLFLHMFQRLHDVVDRFVIFRSLRMSLLDWIGIILGNGLLRHGAFSLHPSPLPLIDMDRTTSHSDLHVEFTTLILRYLLILLPSGIVVYNSSRSLAANPRSSTRAASLILYGPFCLLNIYVSSITSIFLL